MQMAEESKAPASAMKVSAFTPKQAMTKEPEDLSSLVDPYLTASAMQIKTAVEGTTATATVTGATAGGTAGVKGLLAFGKNPEAEAIVKSVSLNDTLLIDPNQSMVVDQAPSTTPRFTGKSIL